jgi:uncharacterized protein (DUF1810 family)
MLWPTLFEVVTVQISYVLENFVWFILVCTRYYAVFALHNRTMYLSYWLLGSAVRLCVGMRNGFES